MLKGDTLLEASDRIHYCYRRILQVCSHGARMIANTVEGGEINEFGQHETKIFHRSKAAHERSRVSPFGNLQNSL